jgi:hypothetical protein
VTIDAGASELHDVATRDGQPAGPTLLAQAFPSLGIGLLVGLLVGLSVSPVVAGVLTSLGGLLGALLGLQSEGEGVFARLRVNGVRIGTFGFACVGGVLLGLFIRTHDVFAMDIKRQLATWTDAGYTREEAQQLVLLQKFNLKPEGKEVVQGATPTAQATVLFNALKDVNLCEQISGAQYDNNPDEVLKAYKRLDKGDAKDRMSPIYARLGRLADAIAREPVDRQRQLLAGMEEVLCGIQALD